MRTQIVIDRDELKKMCQCLEGAVSMEALKSLFLSGMKHAMKIKDVHAMNELTLSKNIAKAKFLEGDRTNDANE